MRRRPERLHYLGVSYGLTQQLFNFWHRAGFRPVYLRQSASETTGEKTVVMIHPLQAADVQVSTAAGVWLVTHQGVAGCR